MISCHGESGGWTLVARVEGMSGDFSPTSPLWANEDVVSPWDAADLTRTTSMKNPGWFSVSNQAVRVCYSGPRSNCATFTHNRGLTLTQFFGSQFAVEVQEQYTFESLMKKLGKHVDLGHLKTVSMLFFITSYCGRPEESAILIFRLVLRMHGMYICSQHSFGFPITRSNRHLITRVLTLYHMKLTQSIASRHQRSISSAFLPPLILKLVCFWNNMSLISQEWCGLNLGNLCNLVADPNREPGTHICRIGCIGDTSLPRSPNGCNPDDYALGIGVSSCNSPGGCHGHVSKTSSLHYSMYSRYGDYQQTAFIYVK